jgi:hypothetical protein
MILEEHGESPEEGGKELLTAHDGKDPSPDERLGDGFGESRTRRSGLWRIGEGDRRSS